QELAGELEVFVEHHQADWHERPAEEAVEIAGLSIEQHGVDSLVLKIEAREIGFDTGRELGEFDEPAHQGKTSPAAISSGREARPSILLRCGKRPNFSMMSRCFFAKPR